MSVARELMELLACPQCKGTVRLLEDERGIVCAACRLLYPVRDDIPVMLIDEAQPLKDD